METIYRCQDCEWTTTEEDEMVCISGLYKGRLSPGDTMPDGECPECGGVCFADETPEEQARGMVRDAAPALLAALEAVIADPGCNGLKVETIRLVLAADARARGVSQ